MRVLDEADVIARRIPDGGDANSTADVLRWRDEYGSSRLRVRDCRLEVSDAPKCGCTPGTWRGGRTGIEAQLVPADVEAHVKGFVEVGVGAEQCRVPRLGAAKVWCGVDDGSQAEQHDTPRIIVVNA